MPKNELSWWDFTNHFSRGLRLCGLWPLYEKDADKPPEPVAKEEESDEECETS